MKWQSFIFLTVSLLPSTTLFSAEGDHAAHENHSHQHHKSQLQKTPEPLMGESIELPVTQLLTQENQSVMFPQEVLADRLVVMDFVYTTCTTVCPVLSAIMIQVQDKLASRVGQDVSLISLTVDPIRDTPQRLAAYSKKLSAGSGWTWLTGDKNNVDRVLISLGAYTPNFQDHPSMVIVGDPVSGQWQRFFGFPNPDEIVAAVNRLNAKRKLSHRHE
ncbi:MAG: SCO family protein [Gammaproteobacteria bacterium]|nr:SCO family protein [Gammaproteobacteria bacterium]MDH5799958.1 SCO family protein [Gammaproteobacteria bacterium]